MRPIDVPHLERTWELAGVEPDPDMFLKNIDAGLDPPMAVITDDLCFVINRASSADVGDARLFLFETWDGDVAKLNVSDAERVLHSTLNDLGSRFRWGIAERDWDSEGSSVLVRETFRDDRGGNDVGPMHFAVWNYGATPPTIVRGTVHPRDGFTVRRTRFEPLK
jgi:hypothetical protein